MKTLPQQTEALPLDWCNADPTTTSVMEAVSFVTPVLENFFIRTVAEGIRANAEGELQQRCLAFIHEESNHSRVHKKFNETLLSRLGQQPPSLTVVGTLLDRATRRMNLCSRLALAAALEHLAAVISKLYVNQQTELKFSSEFAQELFEMHAREELAHRSVVFDLWRACGSSNALMRSSTIALVLGVGAIYVAIAVPWILYRKTGKKIGKTLAHLLSFTIKNFRNAMAQTPVAELLSFARHDFHPDSLIEEAYIHKA